VKRRDLGVLMLLQALVLVLVGTFQHSPGYMDADYYAIMGEQLASGTTNEPFLWNYMDDPAGLPHPGFAYWQPLAALIAALGTRVLGAFGRFTAARAPFFFLALLIPPLTALLAYRLSGRRLWAWISGMLAVASGFYLPYLAVPDTFTLLMLLGAGFLLLAWPRESRSDGVETWRSLGLGVLAGLFYLARAEGFLWLLAAWLVLFARGKRQWKSYGVALGGYLLIAGPWMLRNWQVFGALTAPGGLRALWLTSYNELFDYPASQLTFSHWWASGWRTIVRARMHAGGVNLLSALAVQGQIVWFPFALWAAWQRRKALPVKIGAAMWLVVWLLMSVAFPFAGERGGFFHAAAAVQPLIWALAPLGLGEALRPLARRRGWALPHAEKVLGWGLVGITVLLTIAVVQRRVIGAQFARPAWDEEMRVHAVMDADLRALGVPQDAVVLVNNPPGFTWHTGRPSLVVPNGNAATVAAVAQRYGARYWILESAHPAPLDDVYRNPAAVGSPWHYIGNAGNGAPVFVLEASP